MLEERKELFLVFFTAPSPKHLRLQTHPSLQTGFAGQAEVGDLLIKKMNKIILLIRCIKTIYDIYDMVGYN